MNRMKKRTVLAINLSVWLAAILSATAVAFAGNRPTSPPAHRLSPAAPTTVECAPPSTPLVSVAQPTIYMPDDTIVVAR